MLRRGAAIPRFERWHCVGTSSRLCPDAQNTPLECPQTLLTVFLISPCEHVGHDEAKKTRDCCGEDHVMHPIGPRQSENAAAPRCVPRQGSRPHESQL
jgi:hypothetical protein